jgi:hypothetical protein
MNRACKVLLHLKYHGDLVSLQECLAGAIIYSVSRTRSAPTVFASQAV